MNEVKFEINPILDLENGKRYHVLIKLPISIGWIENMKFIVEKGKENLSFPLKHSKNENNFVYFEGNVDLDTRAIYRYYFNCLINGENKYIKTENIVESNRIIRDEKGKISVNFSVPNWAKGKIMYHIFVDRYKRGSKEKMKLMPRRIIHNSFSEEMIVGPDRDGIWNNDFYGGDLKGITETLSYIKSLGVTIIYLSPIVYSQSNHRYDASDFSQVDPYAGCNDDLKELCDEAHKLGMKVILDAVFNHTGNDSKYFNEYNTFDNVGAFQSKDSPYAKFYRTHEVNGETKYDYWWGMPNLPVCNGYSKEWQDYILGKNGIIDKWFELGIDGLRLDVADELTDEFIEKIRIAVKRNKEDGLIIGEVWKNPMRMNRGYIESGKGMDSVMNYLLIDAMIRYFKYADTNKLSYIISDIKNEYPKDTINTLMNFTSTHDITRAINIFASNKFDEYAEWAWNLKNNNLDWCKNFKLGEEEYKRGSEIYKAYVFTLTFMPGILSIFYGDEVGLQGMGNLLNRKTFPWTKEDLKLLEYFRYIGKIRNKETFLEQADLNILDINKQYMMFERLNELDKALIVVNRTNNEVNLNIPCFYEKEEPTYSLNKSKTKILTPYGGVMIKKNIK